MIPFNLITISSFWGYLLFIGFWFVSIVVAFMLGMYGMVYRLIRNPALHLYFDGKHFQWESRIQTYSGILDENKRKIKPGDIVMMKEDGSFKTLNEMKSKPTNTNARVL